MLFRLNNIGAIYLRLVDQVFKQQIGGNIKIYVDDIIIKKPSDGRLHRKFDRDHANPKAHVP